MILLQLCYICEDITDVNNQINKAFDHFLQLSILHTIDSEFFLFEYTSYWNNCLPKLYHNIHFQNQKYTQICKTKKILYHVNKWHKLQDWYDNPYDFANFLRSHLNIWKYSSYIPLTIKVYRMIMNFLTWYFQFFPRVKSIILDSSIHSYHAFIRGGHHTKQDVIDYRNDISYRTWINILHRHSYFVRLRESEHSFKEINYCINSI